MFPEWHHAVPESAYFKVPETLKTFHMYPISRFLYVLHWMATRLVCPVRIQVIKCLHMVLLHGAIITWCYSVFLNQLFCKYLQTIFKLANLKNV